MRGLAAATPALFALGLLVMGLGAQPYSYSFPPPGPLTFDAGLAYELGRHVAKAFPHKATGTSDAAGAAAWLAETLAGWGYRVEVQEFRARLEVEVTLRNVVARHPRGGGGEEILVLTNYDQAPTAIEAATDTSGHVGVVLALAHALAGERPGRGLTFAFVDGEEWGMLGAGRLAREYPGDRPAAALVVEDMGAGRTLGVAVSPVGQFGGYSPLWMRSLVKGCAQALGLGFAEPQGFLEYAERAVLISFTDQGPLLREGIPAIQVSAWGDEPELTREAYHSPLDRYELISRGALEAYGRVAECSLRSLLTMPSLPREGDYYLLVGEGLVLRPPLLTAAQLLLMAPLYIQLIPARRRLRMGGWREPALYGATLAGLLASYGFAKLLPLLGLMPHYPLYPPPPRHPLLYQPLYGALLAWLAITALLLYLAHRAPWEAPQQPEESRAWLILILAATSIAALAYNPFGATLLLLPAAYLWPHVKPRPGRAGMALNIALLLLGGATIYLLIYAYAGMILVSLPLMFWYLFMGVAYGLFTPGSMLLYLATLAVGIRLLTLAARGSGGPRESRIIRPDPLPPALEEKPTLPVG